jgi:glycosyltransferase involved in cell wall biosynthesis
MVPNGVNTHVYEQVEKQDLKLFRSAFALPEEKLVLFVGRLVYEKGAHVLINAVPKVLAKVDAKFVIVGSGYMKEQLSNIVKSMGLEHKVLFTGFLDDETLLKLQKCADVSVVPSLFEPFGIVALEAMAAKSPVVVSDIGGLAEIVEHDATGIKVYPNNPDSLAWGITKILLDENYRNRIRENAYKKVQEKYDWDKIALHTERIYEGVLGEYSKSFWA